MSSLLSNLNQISAQVKQENDLQPAKTTPTPKVISVPKAKTLKIKPVTLKPKVLDSYIEEITETSVDTEMLTENTKNFIELKLIRKLKSSKDVKKTVDCSYTLDDRLKLFLSDYNKQFRQESEFSILTFQLLCQTALEEYLDNRGY